MRAFVLLLVVPLAFAQASKTTKSVPSKDDHGRHAMTAKEPGETIDHATAHALPLGTGAAADGGAWLRVDVTGSYMIHNATVLGFTANPMKMQAGQIYRVLPHVGPLVWTPPGGKQGPVPKTNLYPPVATVGSGK